MKLKFDHKSASQPDGRGRNPDRRYERKGNIKTVSAPFGVLTVFLRTDYSNLGAQLRCPFAG